MGYRTSWKMKPTPDHVLKGSVVFDAAGCVYTVKKIDAIIQRVPMMEDTPYIVGASV